MKIEEKIKEIEKQIEYLKKKKFKKKKKWNNGLNRY
jgi:hypothetical protein